MDVWCIRRMLVLRLITAYLNKNSSVMGNACNLAVGMSAFQTSTEWYTYGGQSHFGEASLAVDGNAEVEFENSTCIRAGWDMNPWWIVDLSDQYFIDKVAIVTRNWGYMLTNFTIEVGNNLASGNTGLSDPTLCFYSTIQLQGVTVVYPCQTIMAAQFVQVTRWYYKDVVLAFCEVIVYGTKVGLYLISVRGNYAPPSSTWPLSDKSFGVDVGPTGNDVTFSDCVFMPGYPSLSTQSFQKDSNSLIQIWNDSDYFEEDFMLSALIFPTSTSYVIFSYYDTSNNEIFKVTYDGTIIFIEIKDSNGLSLGSVQQTHTVPQNTWSHVGFLREKANGVIKFFIGQEKVIDIDEGFQDHTSLNRTGTIYIGDILNGSETSFTGRISCVQIFPILISEGDMNSFILDTCRETRWLSSLPGQYILLPFVSFQ